LETGEVILNVEFWILDFSQPATRNPNLPTVMDFTIITPNLNYGRYLGDCLSSVASQSGVLLEHLVFDAGSTDDSRAVAAGFPHVRWIEESDRGMSDAINKGFSQAKGQWVMWLNADDRLLPGVLEQTLRALNRSDADVLYGDWNFISEDGRYLRKVKCAGWSMFVHVHHHCLIGSTAAFFRNATVMAEGFRLNEEFRYVMDGEFFARLHVAGKKVKHMPMTVADFRIHPRNASMLHLGKTREMKKILAAERQHVESRAIRRAYGVTLFEDPYLNGLVDGVLWIAARVWKQVRKFV
jgi:glycosyltransferase involved in cell wall biosynthesis